VGEDREQREREINGKGINLREDRLKIIDLRCKKLQTFV
jgi:hypothetical protein